MLVVSRKEDQEISFPGLGITVKLLSVRGSAARVGIEAPRDVRIVRGELESRPPPLSKQERSRIAQRPSVLEPAEESEPHRVRNVLNSVNLFVMVYQKQLERGLHEASAVTFMKLVEYLEEQSNLGHVDFAMQSHANDGIDGHVMIVEDDDQQRDLLSGLLEMQGIQVSSATDGRNAISELRDGNDANVLLLDWSMPEYGGAWLVPRIHEEFGMDRPRMFVLSGADEAKTRRKAKVDAWLPKPVNEEALFARLRAVCSVV